MAVSGGELRADFGKEMLLGGETSLLELEQKKWEAIRS